MTYSIYFLFYFFFATPLVSNDNLDVSGHWEGTGTRDAGSGKRTVYDVELDIMQKGKTIKGISYIHIDMDSKKYHAKMEIEGKISGTYIKYTEMKLLAADSIPNASWCIKKVELIHRFQESKPTLDGIWEGYTNDKKAECVPGRVFLQKKAPRA
jgi:hypothetical protein